MFAGLALLAPHFSLVAVVVLGAVGSGLAISARTLSRAAAAAAAEPHGLLREGNALLNVGFTAGAAAGPALAGLIVAGAGPQTALFADAASFALVAVLLATASGLPRARPEVRRLDHTPAPSARLRRRATAATPPDRRPGRGVRLLHDRDPDRGRIREADARRRGRRVWGPARELGHGHGRRERRLRPPATRLAARPAADLDPRGRGRLSAHRGGTHASRSPVLRRCSAEWETASSGSA